MIEAISRIPVRHPTANFDCLIELATGVKGIRQVFAIRIEFLGNLVLLPPFIQPAINS